MQPDKQVRTSTEKILECERMDAKNKALNVKNQVRNIENNLVIPSKSEEDLLNLIAEIIVEFILEEKE